MLYIRYLLDDFDNIDTETRIDIIQAVEKGLTEKTLTELHLCAIVLFAMGYSTQEISDRLYINSEEYLKSTWNYLETVTGITDSGVLLKHRGAVKEHWLNTANSKIFEDG